MTNKEFIKQIEDVARNGKLRNGLNQTPDDFCKIAVYKKRLFFHIDYIELAKEMKRRVANAEFFSKIAFRESGLDKDEFEPIMIDNSLFYARR